MYETVDVEGSPDIRSGEGGVRDEQMDDGSGGNGDDDANGNDKGNINVDNQVEPTSDKDDNDNEPANDNDDKEPGSANDDNGDKPTSDSDNFPAGDTDNDEADDDPADAVRVFSRASATAKATVAAFAASEGHAHPRVGGLLHNSYSFCHLPHAHSCSCFPLLNILFQPLFLFDLPFLTPTSLSHLITPSLPSPSPTRQANFCSSFVFTMAPTLVGPWSSLQPVRR